MSRNSTTTTTTSTDSTVETFDSAVVASYKGTTDRKVKASLRKSVQASMLIAITVLDMSAAAYAKATLDQLVSESASAPKVEVNPAQVVADRVATLRWAANRLESGNSTPSGLDCTEVDYTTLPEGTVDDTSAEKLASAKITRSGERNSIRSAIERAFDGQPEGTVMKVSEVATAGSLGDYKPSGGAIVAHFGGETEIDGFRLIEADNAGNPRRVQSL